MARKCSVFLAMVMAILAFALPAAAQEVDLKQYPVSNAEGVISQSEVTVDKEA